MNDLQTTWGVEDLYLMTEILWIDAINRRRIQRDAERKAEARQAGRA